VEENDSGLIQGSIAGGTGKKHEEVRIACLGAEIITQQLPSTNHSTSTFVVRNVKNIRFKKP
jgi:hypothetical protein